MFYGLCIVKTVMNELMPRIRYQKILIVLLMLVFGGQAIASVSISCQNQAPSSQSSSQTLISGMVDHSQHLLGLNSSTGEAVSLDDCPDCDCNLHRCFSSTTLPSAQSFSSSIVVSVTSLYNELIDTQFTSSLFRPPISH